jgi:iron complex outermembrane receptor protein
MHPRRTGPAKSRRARAATTCAKAASRSAVRWSPASPTSSWARLAIHQHKSDGFRRNLTLNRDTDARDEFNARLRLTANPSPTVRLEATLLHSDLDDGYDDFASITMASTPTATSPGSTASGPMRAASAATFSGLDGVRLTSVTGGSWVKSRYAYDDDWTAASYMGFSDLYRDRTVFNQELRLDSTATRGAAGWIDRWTLGGFYSKIDEKTAYTDSDPGNIRGLRTNYRSTNTALFGQVSHDLAPDTRLVVGLRTEYVDLDGRGTKTRYRTARRAFDPEVTFAPTFHDTLFGGKVALEHDLSANQLVFASVTRGYKAGGINIDARISPPADPLTYETETLWNYEAGIRGNWLEHRLTGELTAFYLDRRDTQVRDSAGFGGSYRFFTANGHGAHVYGLEAAAAYALTKEFSLRATLSQMGSELDRFTLTNGSSGGGRRLANTPKYGYTLGARYQDKGGLFANAELVARAQQFDSNNQNEARRAFHLVNASLGYTWQAWTVSVWGRNVFNQRYEKRVYLLRQRGPRLHRDPLRRPRRPAPDRDERGVSVLSEGGGLGVVPVFGRHIRAMPERAPWLVAGGVPPDVPVETGTTPGRLTSRLPVWQRGVQMAVIHDRSPRRQGPGPKEKAR